ncbi:MAG: Na/Pi symporter [Spirochaetes bacterium]|nr:Na/Pi symporter [Spirochaetota bacterium]
MVDAEPKNERLNKVIKMLLFIVVLYVFLLSVGLMSSSFKFFGKGFARQLITTTSHPLVGLFIGIFITSIVQSSSVTTSIVVAFVAGGILPIENAVPIVLGSNIGTTVTNTIVSFTQMSNTEEFKRAFSAAIIHDGFNVFNVIIILPLELLTGFLHKGAAVMADLFWGSQTITYHSPLKTILKPVQDPIIHFFHTQITSNQVLAGVLLFIFSILILFMALTFMVKIMKSLLLNRTEVVFNNIVKKAGIIGIIMGTLFTMLVQSSSITTSILVPLAGAGVITLYTVFPIVLGANIGTTITAILAALAANKLGLTIAFVHLLFNLLGTLIFFPIPFMRAIPIKYATVMGNFMATHKKLSILYVILVFYVIPWLLILIF